MALDSGTFLYGLQGHRASPSGGREGESPARRRSNEREAVTSRRESERECDARQCGTPSGLSPHGHAAVGECDRVGAG